MTTSRQPRQESEFHAFQQDRGKDANGNVIAYILVGMKGAVQFVYRTAPETYPPGYPDILRGPMAWDLAYHSPVPRYEGQESRDCDIFQSHKHFGMTECYYDGSSLQAESVMSVLLEYGESDMWEFLIDYYHDVFYGPTGDDVPVNNVGFGQLMDGFRRAFEGLSDPEV